MSSVSNAGGWATKPLIDVATLQRGYDLPVQDRAHGEFPIFAANGPVGVHAVAKCRGPGVVTGRSGTIGKVHFVQGDFWPLNTSLYVTDFHGNDPRWVFYMLQDFGLERFSQGAGVPTLNRNLVHGEPIRVPALPAQRRIAAILDKVGALRTKRREAMAQVDRLAQSIFVEMFGDPATNPKGWPERAMSELFETSPIFGTMIPPSADGGEWLSLRVANIQDWRLDLSDQKFVNLPANMVERHSVKDGDLLLARAIASQAHLGKAVVVSPAGRRWAFDSHLMRLRFNSQALPEFVRHLWMTPGGRSLFLSATRRSAVQFNINTKEMNALRLPIPPTKIQQAFVDRMDVLDSVRQGQATELFQFDGLFAALQHRAFRGEL